MSLYLSLVAIKNCFCVCRNAELLTSFVNKYYTGVVGRMTESERAPTGSGDGGTATAPDTAARAKSRPLLTPEPFSGTRSFSDWLDHFESVAAINDWDDNAKLLWMRVWLIGRAQTAYGRLPESKKGNYPTLKKSRKERFEPDSRRELYLSEFSTRTRKAGEDWAEYADDLRLLADRTSPELEEKAREQLALNQYLSSLDNPQVVFNVKQKRPTDLAGAVGLTLETVSYLRPQPCKLAFVERKEDPIVAAVQNKQDSMMDILQAMMARLDKLEDQAQSLPRPNSTSPRPPRNPLQLSATGVAKRDTSPVGVPDRDAPVNPLWMDPSQRSRTVAASRWLER